MGTRSPPVSRSEVERHGLTMSIRALALAVSVSALVTVACRPAAQRRTPAPRPTTVAAVESIYQDVRYLKDQIDVTKFRSADRNLSGVPLTELVRSYESTRATFVSSLRAVVPSSLAPEDRRALDIMTRTLERDLPPKLTSATDSTTADSVDCRYNADTLATGSKGRDVLAERMYACYGIAARHVEFRGQVLDRLTVLGMLARTDDAEVRRQLFLALSPVWRSVNGDDGPTSPYRHLVRLSAWEWRANGSPAKASARQLGIDPAKMEEWLLSILAKWREVTPNEMLEPWDYYYAAGRASRVLGPRIPRAMLEVLDRRYYHSLGADPATLGIHYDLEPRPGKTPVAFTTFGARARFRSGAWIPAEPWVFATYRVGGLDNLSELLHETGHGIHIAAIRTRPAFADWPDSDPFTEALGDLVALEVYEPAWQQRNLGDSVPLADSFRAKYASITLDIAWALFEVRMHRQPDADPNAVWTEITRDYLKIKPRPELSWWAMRGQLVDSPGYMMNYAIGSIIIADIRARIRALHGSFTLGDSTWYSWVSPRLYRFGLERPSRQVITEFLGRAVSPRALLDDMSRVGNAASSR